MLMSPKGAIASLLPVILTIGLLGCSSSSEEIAAVSPSPAPDLENRRNVESSLEAETVSELRRVWSLSQNTRVEGNFYTASPVVDGDIVYIQDQRSNVEAIDLEEGELLWEKRYNASAIGPNGLTVGGGKIFGATPTTAFALDAKSGKELWSVKLTRNGSEMIAMAPGYHHGLVYFSTSPRDYLGNEVGVLWALDESSGKRIWHFDTVPRGLWGRPEINFGGGLTYAPAFDGEGSMYIGVSHAGPIPGIEDFPWGSSRPGPNLYSNAIVKLDEKTGRVQWYHQIIPHGLCSGFLVGPVLTEARGRKMVLGAGFSGIVVALDRETGELLWRKPVGKHNGHDNDGLVAMRGEYEKLALPMTVYPGLFGGVTGPLAVKGSVIFVPVINAAARLFSQVNVEQVGAPRGELVALDLADGEIRWKHRFPAPLFGPVTVTNDLVFATSLDGGPVALGLDNGEEIWSDKPPDRVEGGVAISDDTLLVRTGYPLAGEMPKLVAYRLSG